MLDEAARPATTRELEALGNVREVRADVPCVDNLKLVIRTRGCDAISPLASFANNGGQRGSRWWSSPTTTRWMVMGRRG